MVLTYNRTGIFMKKIKIGIIGCGNISDIYLQNCTKLFNNLEVKAVADLIPEKAKAKALEYGIPKVYNVEELLSDSEIEIVLNLTIPLAHAEISLAALNAGKSVYSEKPLATNRDDGRKILDLAKEKGLYLGCAPDTFLGGGIQTCRKLIDDGWIGEPIASTAFMTCHGHESWHPDPEFYYQSGGGPMFDMGPYYLTALVNLMGPVSRITGSTKITFKTRTITSQPKYGKGIDVQIPTHVAGILDFASGAIGTIITSFDIWHAQLPFIEIYGTEGTLKVPDPNSFGGPVFLRRHDQSEWKEIPLSHEYSNNSRGIGLADMARAMQTNTKNRASGELAFHVLDIMQGIHDASDRGVHYMPASSCERPVALPLGKLF